MVYLWLKTEVITYRTYHEKKWRKVQLEPSLTKTVKGLVEKWKQDDSQTFMSFSWWLMLTHNIFELWPWFDKGTIELPNMLP